MMYEVYANTIGILEEFEKRELTNTNQDIQRSNVKIPDQSHKTDQDVSLKILYKKKITNRLLNLTKKGRQSLEIRIFHCS